MNLNELVVRKNAPFLSNEVIEVVDEDKIQRLDTIPAETVSDSLVEVVTENRPRPHNDIHAHRDASRFKNLLKKETSSLSTAISKLSENNGHTVQILPYKNNIKTKHKSRKKTFSTSQMVPRVSIPGKHSKWNTSQVKSSWMPSQFASLKHDFLENMKTPTSNENAKIGSNQKDRNITRSPSVLDAFVARMGLDDASNPNHMTPRKTLVGSRTHHSLPKTSSWRKENNHSSPQNVFIQSVTNVATSVKVIKGKPKSLPGSSKSQSVSKKVQKSDMSFKKKQNTIQLEPEVFDSITDVQSSDNEHLISKDPHKSNGSHLISPTHVSSKSLNVSKGTNSVPSQKKMDTIQIEPEVFDSITDMQSSENEHLISKGRHKSNGSHLISPTPVSSKSLSVSKGTNSVPSQTKMDTIHIEPEVFHNIFKETNETEHFILKGQNKSNGKTSKVGQLGHSSVKTAFHKQHKIRAKIPQRPISNSTIDKGQVTHKFRNGSDSSIIRTNEKIARASHTNGGVPMAKNSNDSSNMDLSVNSENGFNIPLNSTIVQHLLDLLSFFNSFYGSNNSYILKPKLHDVDDGTKSNKVKNSTRNQNGENILENLKNFLAFIHVKTPDDNHTRKALVMANTHSLSNDSSYSLSERSGKILQMIYRGWNMASKGEGLRLKTANLNNSSVKNASSLSTDIMEFKSTGSSFNKSREDEFESHLLELMGKASRKELENLKNHILKVLGSRRLRNFSQQNQQTNQPEQQNQAGLNKKHKTREQSLNRDSNNTKHYEKEQLMQHQHQPKSHDVMTETFPLHGPKPKQHPDLVIKIQNHSNTRKNHTYHQQVEYRTTLFQHKPSQVSEALQEQSLNMSNSMNSSTGQNCTSDSFNTKAKINYESQQTKSRFSHSPITNQITNFFHNYLSTSRVNTSTLKGFRIKTKAKTSLSHSPLTHRITNFFHNYLSASHGNNSTLKGVTTKANTSAIHGSSTMALHSLSPKKKGRNTTSLFRAQSSSVVKNASLDAAEHGDDVKNKSVQHHEDVFQEKVVKPNLVVHKLSPKAVEVTEYFEQGKQKFLKTKIKSIIRSMCFKTGSFISAYCLLIIICYHVSF